MGDKIGRNYLKSFVRFKSNFYQHLLIKRGIMEIWKGRDGGTGEIQICMGQKEKP